MLSPSVHRSVRAPVFVSDALLDYLAEQYQANPALQRMHGSFEAFMACVVSGRNRRLLASQRELRNLLLDLELSARRLMRAVEESRRLDSKQQEEIRKGLRGAVVTGNGRAVEKLRHHRHPRGFRDFHPLKES